VLDAMKDDLRRTGMRATESGLRLVLHPDQFVVLSSDSPQVVANSLKILATHAKVMDYLAQPRSSWALMNVHGGKGDRSEQLIKAIDELPDAIRLRLTLENDEYTYSAQKILEVCRRANVPMVFDVHHHACHEGLTSYEDSSVAEMLISRARHGLFPNGNSCMSRTANRISVIAAIAGLSPRCRVVFAMRRGSKSKPNTKNSPSKTHDGLAEQFRKVRLCFIIKETVLRQQKFLTQKPATSYGSKYSKE
jgi:hypothetical protein